MSGGQSCFIWKGHGKTIMMTILSLLGATAAAPERDPEPRRKLVPAPTVVPAAASEPELENPITATLQQLRRTGISPAVSGPVQLVVRALINLRTCKSHLHLCKARSFSRPQHQVERSLKGPDAICLAEPTQDTPKALNPCQDLKPPPHLLQPWHPRPLQN